MRAVRVLAGGLVPSAAWQAWKPGVPHVAAALAAAFVFGAPACLNGLLLATLASFVVYLPVVALFLNGGRPITTEADTPVFTLRVHMLLFALWTLTVWAGAALTAASIS